MKSLLRILLALAATAAAAFAQTGTAIPGGNQSATYVITKPGRYYLAADRTVTANVHIIKVDAPDVTIDLNGFSIGHAQNLNGGAVGFGIKIDAAENIEIRNGSIINTAGSGIEINSGKGVRIVDVRVASPGNEGIRTAAEDTLVDRCSVADAGSVGLFVGPSSIIQDTIVTNCNGVGIGVGKHSRITRSTSRGNAWGVSLTMHCIIENSVISANTAFGITAGSYGTIRENVLHANKGIGIWVTSVGYGMDITGNKISSTEPGPNSPAIGIKCETSTAILTANRLVGNGSNIVGQYVNGGGNILQP